MRFALLAFAALCALAQTPPLPRSSPLNGPSGRSARLEGQVLADANGLPLRRVQVVLTPLESKRPAIAAQTDDHGAFILRDIEPGAYRLSAHRDGYLSTTTFLRDGVRMPPSFTLARADDVTGLIFRLRPWSVLGGKVRYEDGDPAIGVQVQLFRKYHQRGRRGFTQVASAVTNDRGEYRAHGLAPGSYYVAVNLEGDPTGPDIEDQPRLDSSGKEIPVPSYTTTFYPRTTNLSEAQSVLLREADDRSNVDIDLRTVERRTLSGFITDGSTGEIITNAAVTLQRLDSGNTGTLPVPIQLQFDREDDEFHIANVAPGVYQLWVDSSTNNERKVGRATIRVTNGDVDNLELVALPASAWRGEVIAAQGSVPLPREFQPRLTLEPRSERASVLSPAANEKREFEVALLPEEAYDVFVENLPESFYISAILVSGADVRTTGLTGGMATNLPFQVVLDSRGSRVEGGVQGPGEDGDAFGEVAWPGAVVTLIPDPPRDRIQSYRQAYANQSGAFAIAGVPPGRYILTAWFDEPACDIFDEYDLGSCRAAGMPVDVTASSNQSVILHVKPNTGN